MNEGDTITLDAGATDGSGNNLGNGSYSWAVTQNGAAFASGTGAALPVTFGDPGTYVVTLYAGPLVRSSTLTVANIPPTIVSMNVPIALASGITQTFTPTVTDPGKTASNGGLTYYWTLTRNGGAFSSSGPRPWQRRLRVQHPRAGPGFPPDLYTATLLVTDPFGGSTTSTSSFVGIDPSNVTVTTPLDDVDHPAGVTLRDAITIEDQAPNLYTIHFSPALAGQTITLKTAGDTTDFGNSALVVPSGKIIELDASGVPGITIAAAPNTNMRLFYVSPSIGAGARGVLYLLNLTLTGGVAAGAEGHADGGAIYNNGVTYIQGCTLIGNSASGTQGAGRRRVRGGRPRRGRLQQRLVQRVRVYFRRQRRHGGVRQGLRSGWERHRL